MGSPHQSCVAVMAWALAEGWKQSRSEIMSSGKSAMLVSRMKVCSEMANVCEQERKAQASIRRRQFDLLFPSRHVTGFWNVFVTHIVLHFHIVRHHLPGLVVVHCRQHVHPLPGSHSAHGPTTHTDKERGAL